MGAYIGTAGWAIPRVHRDHFPTEGSQLERYARVFHVVEINSSFRHEHRAATYARWAQSTPFDFRFSVKLPQSITHGHRLEAPDRLLSSFLAATRELGPKLGPILVQLPPSLEFDPDRVDSFLGTLREEHSGTVVCEPRHSTWFDEPADRMFHRWRVGRVAADPAVVPAAGIPAGWPDPIYYRLHGAPRKYFSSYDEVSIAALGEALGGFDGDVWCIFDNTAHGAAAGDALRLLATAGVPSGHRGGGPNARPAAGHPGP